MKMMRVIAALVLAVVVTTGSAYARTVSVWEETQRMPQPTEHVDMEDVDITTGDGHLYINTPRQITVKIFTILGQTVTQQTLQPGSHRFRLPAKGIYILKIGSATRRITI